VSPLVYRAMRARLFRDNQNRLPVFRAAFEAQAAAPAPGDYLEFGVARGTSFITAFDMMQEVRPGQASRFHAFDSFEGLPETEGHFEANDMAYSEATFSKYIEKAGVDISRVTRTKGFFERDKTAEAIAALGLTPGAHVVHIDCDLYVSTVEVLKAIEGILRPGSVLIFDDWYSFDREDQPDQHGEQKAFAEWALRDQFAVLKDTPNWNVAFQMT